MIVACVNVGTGYDDKYVYNLKEAVRRSLSLSHRFVCLTDHDIPGVNTIEIDAARTPGWWSKLQLFRDDVFPKGERVLYIDLDTLIPGKLDELAKCDAQFAMLRDFYYPQNLASGLLLFTAGGNEEIFTSWLGYGAPQLKRGDQAWIHMHRPKALALQDYMPNRIKSFKAHAGDRDCDVLCFHGHPRPHEVSGWAADMWNNRSPVVQCCS